MVEMLSVEEAPSDQALGKSSVPAAVNATQGTAEGRGEREAVILLAEAGAERQAACGVSGKLEECENGRGSGDEAQRVTLGSLPAAEAGADQEKQGSTAEREEEGENGTQPDDDPQQACDISMPPFLCKEVNWWVGKQAKRTKGSTEPQREIVGREQVYDFVHSTVGSKQTSALAHRHDLKGDTRKGMQHGEDLPLFNKSAAEGEARGGSAAGNAGEGCSWRVQGVRCAPDRMQDAPVPCARCGRPRKWPSKPLRVPLSDKDAARLSELGVRFEMFAPAHDEMPQLLHGDEAAQFVRSEIPALIPAVPPLCTLAQCRPGRPESLTCVRLHSLACCLLLLLERHLLLLSHSRPTAPHRTHTEHKLPVAGGRRASACTSSPRDLGDETCRRRARTARTARTACAAREASGACGGGARGGRWRGRLGRTRAPRRAWARKVEFVGVVEGAVGIGVAGVGGGGRCRCYGGNRCPC
jgi:hypothetical protein